MRDFGVDRVLCRGEALFFRLMRGGFQRGKDLNDPQSDFEMHS